MEVSSINPSLEQAWKGVLDVGKTLAMLSSSDTAPVAELEAPEVAWDSTPEFTAQSSFHLLIASLCSRGVSLSRCLALNTGDGNNVPWRTLSKYLQNKHSFK